MIQVSETWRRKVIWVDKVTKRLFRNNMIECAPRGTSLPCSQDILAKKMYLRLLQRKKQTFSPKLEIFMCCKPNDIHIAYR